MPTYINSRTGDEVTYDEPNARLESLPNWTRTDPEPTPATPVVTEPPAPTPAKPAPVKKAAAKKAPAKKTTARKG